MNIRAFQDHIGKLYRAHDEKRGIEGTFRWFVEEVGELARALRKQDRKNLEVEFSDCFAWLVSLASLKGVDLEKAIGRYIPVCPKCSEDPCHCPFRA